MAGAFERLPARQIGGFHVIFAPDGPMLPVAERIRAVYHSGGTLSIEREEVVEVQTHWISRVHLRVNDCCVIGDAEIAPHADPLDLAGTFPISRAQIAAVGQALDFAGFGDPKTVLTRPGMSADLSLLETAEAQGAARRVIAGITTILLDGIPYIPLAERLFHLYHAGLSFAMERCEILKVAGTWVYRAIVQVGGQRSIGDAEICVQAPAGAPDAAHPISHAQRVAVGNALALVGFGEVRSILQRQGKAIPPLDVLPRLVSAEEAQCAHQQHSLLTDQQRHHLAALCDRLGHTHPDWSQMDTAQAEALLIALRAEEAELLHAADAARQTTPVAPGEERIAASDPPVEPAQVQQLKRRWRTLVCPTGDTDTLTAQWKAFKVRVCGRWFSDSAMCSAQYTQLALALDQLSSPDAPSLTPPSPRQPPSAPIRQAPRLAVSSPHR